MYYYKFNIGDYASHTKHLTPIEDICYRRLLDWYYLHEKPIPLDIKVTSRMISLSECSTSVEQMLIEFFTKTKVGWINRRSDAEIKVYKSKQISNSNAGTISAIKRKAYIEQMLNGCGTDDEPNNKQETVNKKQETSLLEEGDKINFFKPEMRTAIIVALRSLGIKDVSQMHPDFLETVKDGAEIQEYVDAGRVAVKNGKGFGYVVAIVKNTRKEIKLKLENEPVKKIMNWFESEELTHARCKQEGVEIISDLKQLRTNLNERIQRQQQKQKLNG